MHIPKFATYIPNFGMEKSHREKDFFPEGEIKNLCSTQKQLPEKNMLKFGGQDKKTYLCMKVKVKNGLSTVLP